MAISIEGKPSEVTPVYNEINFYFDSTNKNKKGFRYVFDLYKLGTLTKIAETRGAPRPVDGLGEAKIKRLLSPLVTRLFEPLNFDSSGASENFIQYQLNVGEEFLVEWSYSDYEYYNNAGSQNNGKTQLRQFSTLPALAHSFSIGDQISITQNDGGALKPILTGLHTIVEIVDSFTVVIELQFSSVGSGGTVGGLITYADNRKLIDRDLFTIQGTAFNGAFSFLDFRMYSENEYKIDSLSLNNKLLTTLIDNYKIGTDADLWINWITADSNVGFYAYFRNDAGDTFRKDIQTGSNFISQFYAGVNDVDLSLVSGTAGLVKSNTIFYEFWIADNAGEVASKRYRVVIDRRCKIEDYTLLFEDRLGSFIPILFQLNSEENIKVDRLEYKRELGDFVAHPDPLKAGSWQYDKEEGGTTTVNVMQDRGYLLRSNWLDRQELDYFNELLGSPTIYIKIDGEYLLCSLQTKQVTTVGKGKKKLTRRDINVTLANRDEINI